MIRRYNRSVLIWIIVILAITNISTVATILYNRCSVFECGENVRSNRRGIPNQRINRFIIEELDLDSEQLKLFENFRQKYHEKARALTIQMQYRRRELILDKLDYNLHIHLSDC